MKYIKSTLSITLAILLSACGAVNDKYDGLIVTDGNGKKYILKHNLADAYFIREVQQKPNEHYVAEANSKIQ